MTEDDFIEQLEGQAEQAQEQQGGGQQGPNMEMLRQMAASQLEDKAFSFLADTVTEVETRQASSWNGREAAIETASRIEGTENEADAISGALQDVQVRFVRVLMSMLDMRLSDSYDMEALRQHVQELIIEMHNPETREAILLSVKEQHREDVRDILSEFGMALWGMYEVLAGKDGDNRWFFVQVVASMKNMEMAEVVRQVPDLSMGDVPAEYRD